MEFEEWYETEFGESFTAGLKEHIPNEKLHKLVISYISYAYVSGKSQGFSQAVDMQRSHKKWWQF